MDTPLVAAEKRYEMKKSRSCKMKPQRRNMLRSPMIATKDVDPPMDLGTGRADRQNWAMMSTPLSFTRGNFRPSNQNSNNFRQNRPFERGDYTNNNNNRYNDYRARSQYQSDQDQSKNRGSNNNYSRSPSTSRKDSSFTDFPIRLA